MSSATGGQGSPYLAVQFPDMDAQVEAGKLGVWLFLGSEVLFFGGLFTAYGVYRANHPELFRYAHFFLDWRLGMLNTLVLVGSSLSAAWSVRCAQLGQRKGLRLTLLVTLGLATVFLVVKYFEYSHKLHHGIGWGASCHPSAEILASLPDAARALPVPTHLGTFFSIYFLMTGLHGIHVVIGMGVLAWLALLAWQGKVSGENTTRLELGGMYWHLVDLIWIFLFPLLYLI
jgi:cytochrome c oxidase subunit 3